MSLSRGRRREFGYADAEWLVVMREGETRVRTKKRRVFIPLYLRPIGQCSNLHVTAFLDQINVQLYSSSTSPYAVFINSSEPLHYPLYRLDIQALRRRIPINLSPAVPHINHRTKQSQNTYGGNIGPRLSWCTSGYTCAMVLISSSYTTYTYMIQSALHNAWSKRT